MRRERITSRKNPALQHVRKLLTSRSYREKSGEYAADGVKLLAEAVKWAPETLRTVIVTADVDPGPLPEQVRLVEVPDDIMESVEPFDISEAGPFNTAYLAGYLADKYDVDCDNSIKRANERIRQSAIESFQQTVQGYTNVSPIGANMSVENGSCKYALYPVWILNVKWKDKTYTYAMNGQTGKFVGDIPTETKKASLIGIIGGALAGAIIYGIATLISFL